MVSFCRFRECCDFSVKFNLYFSVRVSEIILVADEATVFGAVALVVVCSVKVASALNISIRERPFFKRLESFPFTANSNPPTSVSKIVGVVFILAALLHCGPDVIKLCSAHSVRLH